MDACATVKVKPWGKDQGEFVEINADDFDPKVHDLVEGESAPAPAREVIGEAALAAPDDVPPSASEDAVAKAAKPAKPAPRRRKRKGKAK
jgi:hypothetical protein